MRSSCRALVAALLLTPAPLLGQSVSGHVIDELSRAPVRDVAVAMIDARGEVRGMILTDSTGVFRMPLPAGGAYQIRAQHPDYATTMTTPLRFRRGEMIAIEIELSRTVVGLAPIVVTGRAREAPTHLNQYYERMRRQQQLGLGRFITREEIDGAATMDVHSLLVREPSLRILNTTWGSQVRDAIVLERRGGSCFPMLYIDAMPVGRANRTELRNMVSTEEIEGIEIYRSPVEAPAELRDECGVIAVWTHRAVVGEGLGNPFTVRRVAIAAGFLTLMTLLR